MKLVTSPGNSTSGTYQPYGLDCSGFVDWVYNTAGLGNNLSGGSDVQWTNSYSISEVDLLPGDLAFKQTPSTAGVNHIGIYYKSENGKNLYIHCTWGRGVIIDSYNFKYFRRPFVKFEGE